MRWECIGIEILMENTKLFLHGNEAEDNRDKFILQTEIYYQKIFLLDLPPCNCAFNLSYGFGSLLFSLVGEKSMSPLGQ